MTLFRQREGSLEKRIVAYAKKTGWKSRKNTSPGRRGVLDQYFYRQYKRIVFMEIKRDDDEEPTEQQLRELRSLAQCGFTVAVVHTYEEACAILDAS